MRPKGVSLLAFFMLAIGILTFASGLSLLVTKDVAFPIFVKEYGEILNETMLVQVDEQMLEMVYNAIAYMAIGFGAAYAVTGWGLLNMYGWSRIVAIILAGMNVVYGLFMVFADPVMIVEVLINLVIIWYLMRSDIKEKFGKKVSIEERVLGEYE